MRNLAFAVLAVIAIEPEAILGVSFQLSFAAVEALVAVMEARLAAHDVDPDPFVPKRGAGPRRGLLAAHLVDRPLALLLATACATSATASFMAYHFHDLSPYVLIGNPLTLTVIEFFAVPGALLGAALYPLGLDAPVWLSAIPLALIGVIGALHGPRYDVIVAPSGDLAAVRDADGALQVVGKRFNAFAAEQWLSADGDGRDPAEARSPDAPCDRLGCVA